MDAEVGLALEVREQLFHGTYEYGRISGLASELTIIYRAAATDSKALKACRVVKEVLNELEAGTDRDDPLRAIRERFHAPLHKVLDEALGKKGT